MSASGGIFSGFASAVKNGSYGMWLVFSGKRLETEHTLAAYNVQAESTLHIMCNMMIGNY